MHRSFLTSLAFATFVFASVFAITVGAQDATAQSADGAVAENGVETPRQPLVFAEGEEVAGAQAAARQPGPLAGTRVETLSTDADREVEVITIPGPGCTAEEGASFVLQDEDGTQADFIDGDNVRITEVREGLEVTSNPAGPDADIVPLNERGGDDVLDTGGLVIVTSTDIECEASTPPPSEPPPNEPPPDNPPPDPTQEPEPQDEEDTDDPGITDTDDPGITDTDDPGGANTGDVAPEDDVIEDTIPDDKPLPDTGGVPLLGLAILGLSVLGAGATILRDT